MKFFAEILAISDVEGALVFSSKGDLLGWKFSPVLEERMETGKWQTFFRHPDEIVRMIQSFEGMQEVEFFFEHRKILLRRAGENYLLVVMGSEASTDMVRLVSDAFMPGLRKAGKTKRFASFFRF